MVMVITIVIYFIAMLLVGYIASKKYITNISDFLVAGRKFPWYMVAAGLLATFVGAGSSMGVAGLGFKLGIAGAWYLIPFGISIISFAFILSRKLAALRQFTVGDILELRYAPATRVISGFWIVIMYFMITAAQIVGMGTIINVILKWPLLHSMIISTAVFVIYTILGGLWAVTLTDFIQAIIMLIGFYILGPILSVSAAGGFSGIEAKLGPQYLSMTNIPGLLLLGFCSLFFLQWVAQDAYQRMFAAKDPKTAYIACLVTGVVVLFLGFGAALVGTSAHALFPDLKPEASAVTMILKVFPSPINAIVTCALIAVIMSTADSVLLVSAMSVTRDFYQRFIKPNASDAQMILVTRVATAIAAIGALLVAIKFTFILKILIYAISIYIAAFVPVVLAAFYWKRVTTTGAIVSMLVGGVSVLLIMFNVPKLEVPALIGLPISALVLIIVSLLTKPENEKAMTFLAKVNV
jgi:SSS family solute:Na+ symporter